MRAAENGKQVTALVELKARFDEENNITWARAMEASGVHVVYGLVGLKTHSKLGFVVRREDDGIRRYVHLGTGNYNEVTARIYTDIGLLTANEEIGEDASKIFNLLTGMSQFPGLKRLIMAPFGLDKEFIKRIERETALAKKAARAKNGEGSDARIIVKMNSLVDPSLIQALYRASQAGVQVDLIVRGICCLRPGIPGLSENIRVRSIIGRFLEHSRIFYFHNGGDEEILCGSADWMPRNFFRRIEIIYPVLDPALRARLKNEILLGALADNTKAREILADGTHVRVKRRPNEPRIGFQATLLAKQKALAAPRLLSAPGSLQLTPRAIPQILGDAIDGLPGTGADPVLQSLQQSLQKQILGAPLQLLIDGNLDELEAKSADQDGEFSLNNLKSDEPQGSKDAPGHEE
jgi:polyphosphate kinase